MPLLLRTTMTMAFARLAPGACVMICGACLLDAQSFDLSSLDKLVQRAKSADVVNLTKDQLRAALQMMPAGKDKDSDLDQAKKIALDIDSVMVRDLTFSRKGDYSDADLEPIRKQLAAQPGWKKIVDSREPSEHAEVYLLTAGDKPGGVAVIDAEAKELTVVIVHGPLKLSELGKLNGLMGVPNVRMEHGARSNNSPRE